MTDEPTDIYPGFDRAHRGEKTTPQHYRDIPAGLHARRGMRPITRDRAEAWFFTLPLAAQELFAEWCKEHIGKSEPDKAAE
jgi:hypothetical protein